MSANHYFTVTRNQDEGSKHFGRWFVIDHYGPGKTVSGPHLEPGPARRDALEFNAVAQAIAQKELDL